MLDENSIVPISALPLSQFREYLRLAQGFADEDIQSALLENFLRSALVAIESRTGKALIERDFTMQLGRWRNSVAETFPIAPIKTLVSVTTLDRLGNRTDHSLSQFIIRQDRHSPALVSIGAALPVIPALGAVEVVFRAGMADSWDALPDDLQMAVMMLAAHYYEFRHGTQYDGRCMPLGVSSVLERYRRISLFSGVMAR